MNLERISIKMAYRDSVYMTLAKISDFSKLYTTILFDQNFSMQKINTGDSIQAFNFKTIEQFKAFRPFKPYNQDQLLYLYSKYGGEFLYQTKLHSGDLVRYNGLKYVVLGIVVNTYAQWNMPTPLLFNPVNINKDYKSLYGSKLSEEQINDKINDNFQAGKYDADMVIPLVDANDFSEYITVLEPRATKDEVEIMFDTVNAEKNLTIKSQKDVFIDTMLRLKGNEINQIKAVNEQLFKGVQTLLISVNKAVNEQIELLPEPAPEIPQVESQPKKVIKESLPQTVVKSEDLPDLIDVRLKLKDLPEPVQKLAIFITKQQFPHRTIEEVLDSTIAFNFSWADTLEGFDFWYIIHNDGNLTEFKKKYGNKGELVDAIISEPVVEVESEDLPDTIGIESKLKDLPEPIKKLVIFRAEQQNTTFRDYQTIRNIITWDETPEGSGFWAEINNFGNLKQFKKKYGNKGELVDAIISEPVVKTQEVKYVELIIYPPSGGILELKTFSKYELSGLVSTVFYLKPEKTLKLNFKAFTDGSSYTTQINVKESDSSHIILSKLIEQYDTFVKPELNWKSFVKREANKDRIKLNDEILTDALKPEVKTKPFEPPQKSKERVRPKPVEAEKPKPVEKPKPTKVEKPKPVKVEKPAPVKVEKPKPTKEVKPKKPKAKAEFVDEDLSFLDDLDKIF